MDCMGQMILYLLKGVFHVFHEGVVPRRVWNDIEVAGTYSQNQSEMENLNFKMFTLHLCCYWHFI